MGMPTYLVRVHPNNLDPKYGLGSSWQCYHTPQSTCGLPRPFQRNQRWWWWHLEPRINQCIRAWVNHSHWQTVYKSKAYQDSYLTVDQFLNNSWHCLGWGANHCKFYWFWDILYWWVCLDTKYSWALGVDGIDGSTEWWCAQVLNNSTTDWTLLLSSTNNCDALWEEQRP